MLRLLIGSSTVQTTATSRLAKYLSKKMGRDVSIGSVDISFLTEVKLGDLMVKDHHQDTLLYLKELAVEIEGYELNKQKVHLEFGEVYLKDASFYMRCYEEEESNNLIQLISFFASNDTTVSANSDLVISSPHVLIEGLNYIYDNQNDSIEPSGVDWDHLNIRNTYLDLVDFNLHNDTINGEFLSFSLQEQSGFILDNFKGKATFSNTLTQVDELIIQTPQTDLDMDLIFRYDSLADYSDFINSVLMKGKVRDSDVSFEDIAYFAPDLNGLEETVELSGRVRGTVSNFTAKSLDIKIADRTTLKGRVDINGLPDINETFLQLDLTELHTNANDLAQIPIYPFESREKLKVPDLVHKLGEMEFEGNFTGFINDFVAYGKLDTDIGRIKTDLQLANDKSTNNLAYHGNLITNSFDLGTLLDQPREILGGIGLNAEITGKGVDDDLSATIKGNIHSIEINQYEYKDISLNGSWDHSKFLGDFHIKDENIYFDFDGELDFSQELPHIDFKANLVDAKIDQLNWADRDSTALLSTEILIKFDGNSIDNILGRIALQDISYVERDNELKLEKIELVARGAEGWKTIGFESDHVQSYISGRFDSRKLPQNFEYMLYKILPSFFEIPPALPDTTQKFDFNLKITELEEFSKLFIPGLNNIEGLELTSSLDAKENLVIIDLAANDIDLPSIDLVEPRLHIQSHSDSIGIEGYVKKGILSDSISLDSLIVHAHATSDVLHTDLTWDNHDLEHMLRGNLSFETQVLRSDVYRLDFLNSEIQMLDNLWQIVDSNYVLYDGEELKVSNFKLTNNDQYLRIHGVISEVPEKTIQLELHHFDLAKINSFLPESVKLKGVVQGKAVLKDVYNSLILNSNFDLDDIEFNDNSLGTGRLFSYWQKGNEKIDLNFNLKEEDLNKISLAGSYYPFKQDSNLAFNLSIREFPINIVEPFLEENIDEMRGKLNGNISVTGNPEKTKLNGSFQLMRGHAHIKYLNTSYSIEKADFFIYEDLIGCDYISVFDEEKREAKVNVSIFHDYFEDFNYDIWISADNGMLAMNTTREDNDLFFGKATITPGSTVTIETGRKGSINMEVTAGTAAGTKIYLPLDYADQVDDAQYIFFKDTARKVDIYKPSAIDFEGFSMNFNLTVDENAEAFLIFDETAGDVISASGKGNIKMSINQSGDFGLTGDYEITKGEYLFTLESIINKKFKVGAGSTIRWEGDPFDGDADIEAYYPLRTNLLDLGLNFSADTTELLKRIPVDLLLRMKGNYMEPDVSFDFRLPEEYSDYQNYLSNLDQGGKSMQAISLLLLNRFMPVGGNNIAAGNALGKSGSELLSRQLSGWLSQISDEFNLDFEYQPGDELSSEQVQLALSTQLWNDKITFETNIGYQGDNPNAVQENSNQVIGDFKLEYKISEDGKVKGSVFHRTNEDNAIQNNQFPYTQGVGIIYREDFETFSNFMCRIRRRLTSKENRDKLDCTAIERKRILEKREKQNERLEKKYGTSNSASN